ncbi:hypothetical protein N1851_017626 [Merluccius polli]|uniref:Uncharacterized protein n=1 Tax=Merluccius polli TaxID=89951 RepID=A0AA47NYX2_MERPO|nr:hypothetical protein N1851_017626 [Merluccius polli]
MSPHDDVDMESVYSQFCASVEGDTTVIFQNTQRLSAKDYLFYTSVSIQSAVTLRSMLDSGSMACSLSSRVLPLLETSNIVSSDSISPTDDLILGSNVIKHLIRVLKTSDDFWDKVSLPDKSAVDDENLLQLLASVEKWRGSEMPDKVGTVKLKHAVTLEPMKEHLVWGSHECLSAGSTVIVEPSESRTVPRTVMVGRIVTPLWGDGWVPVRVINPSNKPVNLRRNCKLADVSPCTALEDFDNDYLYANAKTDNVKCNVTRTINKTNTGSEQGLTVDSDYAPPKLSGSVLRDLGLQDIDVDSGELSPFWKSKLVELVAKYESIFSRHSLDCGKAKDFVHRIRQQTLQTALSSSVSFTL